MGNGGLTPSVLSTVEEWLAFNASGRRAGERQGRFARSSEAEMICQLEGRFATLERGGDRHAGLRGVRMDRTLGFFESFAFFQIGRRHWAFVGPVALTSVCIFQSDFSIPIRVSLIVVPDK